MSKTTTLERGLAQELATCSVGRGYEGWTVVENQIMDHSRWSIQYRLMIKNAAEEFYQRIYSIWATEQQDEMPFEYDDDGVEFRRVYPVIVEVTQYQEASNE